ncbi:ParB/RepB/Spo0J family partition protein [Faecalitalea cylindroides]|uniref:ParB-like protein n=1 Tax=Faecalitalea cylindroides ATCC 27803 TaxID=649755 RepID=U2PTT1_9FIRM|nr:ParB/RepB/Spo0J family partition protein [Faecalitalea cylindroides]ERK47501.1 ParB-like protein [[Eubacterium] cylindroides ATCC 27803] [Faecalitalea cylindroides ATCC 27803]
MRKIDLGLPTYEESLFSTEEQRQEAKLEKVMKIPIDEIHSFKNHPFHVRQDEEMQKLIDSVLENGILIPVLVRPDKDGNGYEMISGHRRKFALEFNGAKEIDAIVRDLDDDQATIIMVDSNIQRENILPTERGFAYRMKLEAMKHQGKRTDLTSSQVGTKLKRADDLLADQVGESRNQIQRYIRLTYLVKPLRDMVDGIHEDGFTIALNPAYELSFLTIKEQNELVQIIQDTLATPSLSQSQEMKRKSQDGSLSPDTMMDMLLTEKPNQKEKLSFKMEEINKYFPRSYTPNQKKELIIKLLGEWQKKKEKAQSR